MATKAKTSTKTKKNRAAIKPVLSQPTKRSNKRLVSEQKPRKLKVAGYKSFRLHKKIKPALPRLSSPYRLLRASFKLLFTNWRLFGGLTLVYALLTLLLVRGFGSDLQLGDLKGTLQDIFKGDGFGSSVAISASLFGLLLGTAGSTSSPTGAVYQSLLLVVIALVVIWFLRKVSIGERVRIRDGFYRGLYPLGVFVPLLVVIGIQLIPLLVGAWLYGVLVGGGIVVSFAEKFISLVLFGLLAILSLYMVTSSVFGLYISTLPGMTPMKALRSARQLVLYRRGNVLLRLLALLVALPVMSAIFMLPFILFLTVIAEWLFFILTMFGTILAITYVYLLYRDLLNE